MDSKATCIFVSDLDNTLVGHNESLRDFSLTWAALPKDCRPLLVYNTGRLLEDTLKLIRKTDLPNPDYVIAGVGTTIYDFRNRKTVKAFTEVLEEGWDREKVEQVLTSLNLPLKKQPAHFQNDFKSSWYLADAEDETLETIRLALEKAELDTHLIYSSARDLDILPNWANKGNATKWLLRHLDIPPTAALVAGDSGNDSEMFNIPGIRGIVVENAQPELLEATVRAVKFHATEVCAAGVLEGLRHFGLCREILHAQLEDPLEQAEDPELRHLLDEEQPQILTGEQLDFLATAYSKAVEGLRRNITPLGFSACSLKDNESRGTDANYHSVWARDGSITVIGSLVLDDEEIGQCQRRTLETLLSHLSPTGQVPANVRLDDGIPDYSGVGRISSIDSGLWLIIAVYEFVRKTNDLAFLRTHRTRLQAIMNWLSAHDSNNDALLEIPEAGDWTDLFGRSYNVLYDEVLWYRANIAFGRMLELLGQWKSAGDYLRWARTIKSTILNIFWPSTTHENGRKATFADSQFSMGDTNYLLAQVTPFGFDWRCDVYGNILACLFNVLDFERARIAFRFMWGVGVAEPFPVSNLYPVVDSGDPEWRSYYTVNLLNLPHHYHNGGIWPFIGAQWVRFIHRLGMRDLAMEELYRLAQINEKGVTHDWEFNEWAHGKTGKPMGKAYQAWSCSEFICAYHTLGFGE